MKKFYFALAAVAAILAGCSKEVDNLKPEPVTPGEKTVSLKASVGDPQTKVSSDNAGVFKWQDTDKITILTNNGNVRQFTIGEITDGTSAEFSGTIPDEEGETINYALYPASTSHFTDGTDNILFHIDDQVIWDADASNMPMRAKVDGSASFKAVGGVLKLILFNIPADADYLKFSATNKQISGDFEIADASISAPVIATAVIKNNNNVQVIDFSANYSSSKVFYIPLPTGTIDGFTVALYETLEAEPLYTVTSTKSLSVTANKLIIAPAMNCYPTPADASLTNAEIIDTTTGVPGSYNKTEENTLESASGDWVYFYCCKQASKLQIYANSGYLKLPAFSENIKSITLNSVYNGSDNAFGGTVNLKATKDGSNVASVDCSGISAGDNVVLTPSSNISTGYIYVSSACRITSVTVKFKGGEDDLPEITPTDNELTIAVGESTATTTVTLSNPVDGLGVSAFVSGANANNFTASISGSTLTVTAKAANPTAADYTATVTLKASGAAAKTINVTQESALVPNPTDLAAVAGNATVDITWTGNANASSYVAYLHTAPTETPASGGTDISSSISHDGQAYIIDDYSVDNDQTYYVYVKVSGVAAGYDAPADYVVASFTPAAAKGTAANPYTVAEAILNTPASGTSDNVYIHGFVSAFYGSNTDIITDNYHRYYISDDGTTTTQLLVFDGKGLNNVVFSSADDLTVGDEVTILGGLTTYKSTKEVAANNYIVSRVIKCATPVFSPAQGTYYATQNVTITTSTAGATIYYTTDGNEPTTLYSEPIAVSADLTIKAIAVKENFVTSAVAVAEYNIEDAEKLATPTIAVDSYTHNSITFSWEAVEHATGYQVSIDGGTNWLAKQEELTYNWTGLSANTSYTIKVKAIGTTNGQYTDSDVASKSQTTAAPKTLVSIALTTAPTKTTYNVNEAFSLAGAVITATYSDESTADVTASCETQYDFSTIGNKTVTISYAEGGITRTCEFNVTVAIVDVLNNEWTEISGTSYTAVTRTGSASKVNYSIQAAGGNSSIQLRSDNNNSGIVTTESANRAVKKITIKWNSNTNSARKVDIYGKNSPYSAPSDLYNASTQGTKVKTFTKSEGDGSYSFEADYVYIGIRSNSGALYIDEIDIEWGEAVAVATPTFSVAGGNYDEAQSVTISCATGGATIYYTTDGSTPTSGSTAYSTAVNVNTSMTLKAIAIKGVDESAVASATYTLKVKTPTFSPAGGSYDSTQSVAISCGTAGATIHYTTDNTEPTAQSTTYGGAISVSETTTIKAIAIKDGWTNSDMASATYTIGGGGDTVPDPDDITVNALSLSGENCTIVFAKLPSGSNNPAVAGTGVRAYVKNTITVTATSGNIDKIDLTCKSNTGGSGANKAYPTSFTGNHGNDFSPAFDFNGTTTTYTYTPNEDTGEVVFTVDGAKGNVEFSKIKVYYK